MTGQGVMGCVALLSGGGWKSCLGEGLPLPPILHPQRHRGLCSVPAMQSSIAVPWPASLLLCQALSLPPTSLLKFGDPLCKVRARNLRLAQALPSACNCITEEAGNVRSMGEGRAASSARGEGKKELQQFLSRCCNLGGLRLGQWDRWRMGLRGGGCWPRGTAASPAHLQSWL